MPYESIKRVYLPKNYDKMNTRIKELIKEKGYTQKDFAEKLGMTYQSLFQIINGQPSMPSLIKIAEALGVELWELFADGREIAARYQEQDEETGTLLCPHCGNECELHVKGSRIELRTPTPWKK